MKYTFNEIDKNILRKLKNSVPKRIWTEFVKIVFEFDGYCIELECIPRIASSPNDGDEAMTTQIREIEKNYSPPKSAIIVLENKEITGVHCVRTLLYFTVATTEPEMVKKSESQLRKLLSKVSGVSKRKIDEMIKGYSSYHEEIICKPGTVDVKEEFSNLIDVGLIIEFDNYYLPAFIQRNSFGFADVERQSLLQSEELKEILSEYEVY